MTYWIGWPLVGKGFLGGPKKAITYHHLQDFDRTNCLLTLVKTANHICHQMGIGPKHDAAIDLLETEEAHLINLTKADLEDVENFLKTTPILTG